MDQRKLLLISQDIMVRLSVLKLKQQRIGFLQYLHLLPCQRLVENRPLVCLKHLKRLRQVMVLIIEENKPRLLMDILVNIGQSNRP